MGMAVKATLFFFLLGVFYRDMIYNFKLPSLDNVFISELLILIPDLTPTSLTQSSHRDLCRLNTMC